MTTTLLTVPKRMLGRMKAPAHRRKTRVFHLLREAVEKTYGIDARHADAAAFIRFAKKAELHTNNLVFSETMT